MKLTDIYNQDKTILSFEIFPPKAESELNNIDETLEMLCDLHPDYISVTFGAGGSSNNNKTIAICKKIKEQYHTEPVAHLTCLSYDKHEIDEFSKELEDAGIENILALRGDVNPNPDKVTEIRNLKKKVDAGADVLLSQLFFDNKYFFDMVESARIAGIDVPITPGIMPCLTVASIKRMVSTCGATLPENFQRIVDRYGDNPDAFLDAGLAYAISQIIDLLTTGCDGIHLYTMNRPSAVKRICDGIKNII